MAYLVAAYAKLPRVYGEGDELLDEITDLGADVSGVLRDWCLANVVHRFSGESLQFCQSLP